MPYLNPYQRALNNAACMVYHAIHCRETSKEPSQAKWFLRKAIQYTQEACQAAKLMGPEKFNFDDWDEGGQFQDWTLEEWLSHINDSQHRTGGHAGHLHSQQND